MTNRITNEEMTGACESIVNRIAKNGNRGVTEMKERKTAKSRQLCGRSVAGHRLIRCPPTSHTTFGSRVRDPHPIHRAAFARSVDRSAQFALYHSIHYRPASGGGD